MKILEKIRRGTLATFMIWREEFEHVYKDVGVLLFFIIAPLGYPILYSFIYNNQTVKEVPTVFVDKSNTPESREFRRMMDASQNVKMAGVCANMEEAKEAIREHKAYGIVEFPYDFGKCINRGNPTCIHLYCDMSSLLYYKAIMLTASEVSMDMNANIQIKRAGNYTSKQDEILTQPLKFKEVTFFNSKNGYASFLIPAVLVLILQQMMLLGVGMAFGTSRERNYGHNLVPANSIYFGTFRNVFGKSLCYVVIWVVMAVYLLWLIPKIFNLVQEGDPWAIIGFAVPFVLSCIFFCMTMGAIVRERESVFVIFVCTSVVLLFLSGISWPLYSMPKGWVIFSQIFPSTPAIQGFVKLNTMGANLTDVHTEYMHLWTQCIFYFCTTCLLFRYEVKKSMTFFKK